MYSGKAIRDSLQKWKNSRAGIVGDGVKDIRVDSKDGHHVGILFGQPVFEHRQRGGEALAHKFLLVKLLDAMVSELMQCIGYIAALEAELSATRGVLNEVVSDDASIVAALECSENVPAHTAADMQLVESMLRHLEATEWLSFHGRPACGSCKRLKVEGHSEDCTHQALAHELWAKFESMLPKVRPPTKKPKVQDVASNAEDEFVWFAD